MISNINDLVRKGHEVHCLHFSHDKNHPVNFDLTQTPLALSFQNIENLSEDEILALIKGHNPEICIVGGWNIKKYKNVIRNLEIYRVLAMDNPWQNQPRQWLGVLFRKQLIRPFFDSALVPGTKQEKFAEKLGFKRNSIYRNLFSIDKNIFTKSKA
jgi:hypothetical protein